MKRVVAYGPEILAMEGYFEGKTIILDGFQRFFILHNSKLYCNFTESENGWMAARLYEIEDEEDYEKFYELYPDDYTRKTLEIEERDLTPLIDTAETLIGTNPDFQVPLNKPREITYTIYQNLEISISSVFASKFALSTHKKLTQKEMPIVTSYFSDLDEISLLKCRNEILTN